MYLHYLVIRLIVNRLFSVFCFVLDNDFTSNLPRNLPVKKFENRLRFDKIMATSLWLQFFFSPPSSQSIGIEAADRY